MSNNKNIVVYSILTAILFLIFITVSTMRTSTSIESSKVGNRTINPIITQYDASGEAKLALQAQSINKLSNTIDANAVSVQYFAGSDYTIKANHAKQINENNLTFEDAVVTVSDHQPCAFQLKSKLLKYNRQTQKIYTDNTILLQYGDMKCTMTGGELDLTTKDFKMGKNIQVEIHPNQMCDSKYTGKIS